MVGTATFSLPLQLDGYPEELPSLINLASHILIVIVPSHSDRNDLLRKGPVAYNSRVSNRNNLREGLNTCDKGAHNSDCSCNATRSNNYTAHHGPRDSSRHNKTRVF